MIHHYETAKYQRTRHLKVKRPAETTTLRLFLDEADRDQTVLGYGGAFTEAAAITFASMSEAHQRTFLEAYFNPLTGLGYTLGRVAIHSCDFALGHYTYIDEGDTTLESFSIERDTRYVLPMIRSAEAEAGRTIDLLASPWSPPAWMKTNKQMAQGGKLLKSYYDLWARYFIKFIEAYTKAGLSIFAVTVQNEPAAVQVWDSCEYTAEEEKHFVKEHLGPMLHASPYRDVKLLIWDHNRDLMVERARAILSDPEAAQYVWGTAFHWYVSEDFEQVGTVHKEFPDKGLLFTEGCIEGGPQPGVFENGERYARNMIGDFSNGCQGYLDWNLILNSQGGPNHVGNYCDAPMLYDAAADTLTINTTYHAIQHFSAHVKPGAIRIASKLEHPDIGHVAFKNPDGSIALIIQNESEADVGIRIETPTGPHDVTCVRRSISTFVLRGDAL